MSKTKGVVMIIIIVIIGLISYTIWANKKIETTNYNIVSQSIPENFNNFKIVQISDLHNTEFGENNIKLINLIKESEPSIIVVTGDALDSRRTDVDTTFEFFQQAIKIAPTYYVMGNHELRIMKDYEDLKNKIIDIGVIVLEDESVILENNGDKVKIIGMNDLGDGYDDYDKKVFEEKLKELNNEDMYSILLSHRPEIFDLYVESNINLVFTGHVHGGQFRLPIIGGIFAPSQGLFPKYDGGLYRENGTNMVVSRGLGNSIIPIRINNKPEIVVAELKTTY